MDDSVNKHLKPAVQMALVDGRNGFAAFSQLASGKERNNWQSEGLQMCSVIRRDQQQMTAQEIDNYGRFCNVLCGLVLSDSNF